MCQTAADSALEARYEKYREILKGLTIMSDIFMRNVFKKQECTEYVLRVIMGRNGLKVLDQVSSVRLYDGVFIRLFGCDVAA